MPFYLVLVLRLLQLCLFLLQLLQVDEQFLLHTGVQLEVRNSGNLFGDHVETEVLVFLS